MSNVAGKPLRVVQVTDSHLFADTEGKLLGLNTQFSLDKVLERVHEEQKNMDLLLATGDLAQDASYEAYKRLEMALMDFGVPIYWLEGNHDKPAPMIKALEAHKGRISPCSLTRDNWTLVMLDSTIPDEVPGELYDEDLAFLDQALKSAEGEHIMVCLHHHPVPMGCKWLDTQVVASADKFFQVLDRYPKVRAVLWGHVHQEFDGERNGVRLISTPSTCVQFKPLSDDFSVDDVPPGYRWLDLYPDGRIDTAVSRVENIKFEVDFTVKGY